jgi:preprotein translocase subunit YajC
MHLLALATVLAAEDAPAAGGGALSFLPLLLIVAVFYFLLIRPQQRKARAHQALVQSVAPGDRIVTIGGIHGTVERMDDETVRIEIAPGITITMARGAVAKKVVDADTGAEDAAEDGTDSVDAP